MLTVIGTSLANSSRTKFPFSVSMVAMYCLPVSMVIGGGAEYVLGFDDGDGGDDDGDGGGGGDGVGVGSGASPAHDAEKSGTVTRMIPAIRSRRLAVID